MRRDECTVCGGRNGHHYPWCGHARTVVYFRTGLASPGKKVTP